MRLHCRMLIEQCAAKLHKLRAATRAAALQSDLSGGMDQRRVCQMMWIASFDIGCIGASWNVNAYSSNVKIYPFWVVASPLLASTMSNYPRPT
jgi:hypothetical protein